MELLDCVAAKFHEEPGVFKLLVSLDAVGVCECIFVQCNPFIDSRGMLTSIGYNTKQPTLNLGRTLSLE